MGRLMSRVASAILRTGEIVCGGVVLAVNAHSIFLLRRDHQDIDSFKPNSIYVTSLSAASILIASLLLVPQDHTFRHFPLDFVLTVGWFAAFALLIVNFGHGTCQQGTAGFATLALGGSCNEARAAWGFSFLCGCLWAASTVVGLWVVTRDKTLKDRDAAARRGTPRP